MGLMSHTSSSKVKFGLASLAAAGALYCAVVVFDLGSTSPVALGSNNDRASTVVRVPPRDFAVPGPARRLPQVSPGPARRQLGKQPRGPVRRGQTKPAQGTHHAGETPGNLPASSPVKTRETLSGPPASPGPPSVPPVVPPVTLPPVSLPELPLPPVTIPALQIPPVQVPVPPVPPPTLP